MPTITGTSGNDTITPTTSTVGEFTTNGPDVIDAGGGNDTVDAGGGDDVIVQKDRGSDSVDGGAGTDTLVIDYSGETTDYIFSGRGMWVSYYDAAGTFLGRSGVGSELEPPAATARWGFNSANYGVTFTDIERFDLTGTPYHDMLRGGALDDTIRGGGGSDVLIGGGGNDALDDNTRGDITA